MSRTISLSASALRYVLPHVSDDESRPGLRGVYVSADGTIAATTGKSLAVHRNAATTDGPALLRFHKPASVTARKVATVVVEIDDSRTECPVTLLDDLGRTLSMSLADLLPEQFPNIAQLFVGIGDRIRQGGEPVGAISLDPEQLARFSVAKSKYDVEPVRFIFGGPSRAAFVVWKNNPDAIGLVMPFQPPADEVMANAANLADSLSPVPAGV